MNEQVSGVIGIKKSDGMTSHDVVNRLRRLYATRQVGHTGTLDPMATGVLVIMVGRAVKASEYITASEKGYRAVIRLGIKTDTGDITGNVIARCDDIPQSERVISAAIGFIGKQMQTPPMYSALKVDGKKLVDLARRGIEVEREAREIEIYSLECEPTARDDEYVLTVRCSKGTYIRTLCEDIGEYLGCGGTMAALERTMTGGFELSGAVTLETLEALGTDERIQLLHPAESLFADCPKVMLPEFFARLAHSGAEIYQHKIETSYETGVYVRLCDKDGFFALGQVNDYEDGSAIKPIKQFVI